MAGATPDQKKMNRIAARRRRRSKLSVATLLLIATAFIVLFLSMAQQSGCSMGHLKGPGIDSVSVKKTSF